MRLFDVVKNLYRTPHAKSSRYGQIRLDMNENTLGVPQSFIESVLKQVTPNTLIGYPEVYTLYETLSQFLKVNESELMLTNGSDSGIRAVFEIFTKPNDHVAFFMPSFVMYDIYTKIFSLNTIAMNYKNNEQIDFSSLFSNLDKIKLVVLTNPNSPLGTPIKESELKEVFQITLEKNIPVLLDEAYCEFNTGFNYTMFHREFPNVITTRTFSKAFGLAGVRLGYLMASPEMITTIKNAEPSFDINAFAILFANALLKQPEYVLNYLEKVNAAKAYFKKEMDTLKIETISSAANSMMYKIENADLRKAIFTDLQNNKILIKESIMPPFQNYMRLSFGTHEQIEMVVESIKKHVVR
jgi:histidinol-phosphate aminotransferase